MGSPPHKRKAPPAELQSDHWGMNGFTSIANVSLATVL